MEREVSDGLSERKKLVIATGGWAGWLAERIPEVDRVEPTLVLDGVRILSGSADR